MTISEPFVGPPMDEPDARARWLLIAMHAPFAAFTGMQVATGMGGFAADHGAVGVPLVLCAALLQLRHSLSAAAGGRPRWWQASLVLLLLVAYLPLPVYTDRWFTLQWLVVGSVAMLLRLRLALALCAAIVVGWIVHDVLTNAAMTTGQLAWRSVYRTTIVLMGGGALYGAARLVLIIHELRRARARLRDAAVGRERARISRDLHDLLGHSLSAVSLKADLAVALLTRGDAARAAMEVDSLVSVASTALRDLRGLPHAGPLLSLRDELGRAAELLEVRGIVLRNAVAAERLPPQIADVFAWCVREAVTNVLRHASATQCAIQAGAADGGFVLTVENDGAPERADTLRSAWGSGLAGLASRAEALGGSAEGCALPGGRFAVTVSIPENEA